MLLLYRFSSSVTVVQFSTHSIGPSDISILKVDRLFCDTCRHSFAYIWRSPLMSIFMLYTRFTFLLFTAHQLHESRIKNKPFYRYYNHTRASDNRSILLTRYLNPNAFFAFTQNLWWTVSTQYTYTHIFCSVCGQRHFMIQFQFRIDNIDTKTFVESIRVFGCNKNCYINKHLLVIWFLLCLRSESNAIIQKKRLRETF